MSRAQNDSSNACHPMKPVRDHACFFGRLVVVIGLGGVGSHAAHLLLRGGIRRMRLVDFDQVSLSSLNRHATANRGDVGLSKAAALRSALMEIEPTADLEACVALFEDAAAARLLAGQPVMVIDAIDDLATKAALLGHCIRMELPVVSALGAGGKADACKMHIGRLSEVFNDPIAASMLKRLRKQKQLAARALAASAGDPAAGDGIADLDVHVLPEDGLVAGDVVSGGGGAKDEDLEAASAAGKVGGEGGGGEGGDSATASAEEPLSKNARKRLLKASQKGGGKGGGGKGSGGKGGDGGEGGEGEGEGGGGGKGGKDKGGKAKAKGGQVQWETWWEEMEDKVTVVYSSEQQRVSLLPIPEGVAASELGSQPNFRVRVIPVLPPLPAAAGATIAAHALATLSGKPVRPPARPVPSLSITYLTKLYQTFVKHETVELKRPHPILAYHEVALVVCDVFRCRCALTGRRLHDPARPKFCLIRFDASREADAANVVFVVAEAAERHEREGIEALPAKLRLHVEDAFFDALYGRPLSIFEEESMRLGHDTSPLRLPEGG